MNRIQTEIHRRAVSLKRQHGRIEADIIENLQEAQAAKLFLEFGLTSLFLYATEILGYTESVAYTFISVARKAIQFPDLQVAVRRQKLSASKAARIASTLKPENARELVEFACSHSMREIDREVARINPRAAGKDRVRQLSDDFVEITVTVPREVYEHMKRAEEIHGLSRAGTLKRVYEEHVVRHDPVRKADRNKAELCSTRVGNLNAAEMHAVNARDRGQCTELDSRDRRCPNQRWTDIHHIVYRKDGGTNALSNLTTLCKTHHQMKHRPRIYIWPRATPGAKPHSD
jgi:hypothetical protein